MIYTNQQTNAAAPTVWTAPAPYTAMLREYAAAAAKLDARLFVLRGELRAMAQCTPPARTALERRILLLRDEREEIRAVMRTLREYAEREVQS